MPVYSEVYDPEKQHVAARLWLPEASVEPQALQQVRNLASLPFVFKHVAVMPDVHLGIGATVGSVIATRNALIPAAVGVDIGCGMMAVKTPLSFRRVEEKLARVRSLIEAEIPVGMSSRKSEAELAQRWSGWKEWRNLTWSESDLEKRARLQIGTLGGGNHFIEVCKDGEDAVWVLLHSGSRNIGKTLAERHIRRAKSHVGQMLERPPDPDLAHFTQGTAEFDAYVRDLRWAQDYAFQNRRVMMDGVLRGLARLFDLPAVLKPLLEVNCHHNYAEEEVHFGEKVWVTRKGAVRAGLGDLGVIPGSMGARSYIVRGRGNPDSFSSCSHGAGRRMSRSEAKRRFTVEDLRAQTHGVESRKDAGVVDEIPGAYKDIDLVLKQQEDLVEVVAVVKQLVCVKG